jgi:hypothetical protein
VRSHRTLLAVDPRSFAVRRPAAPVVPDDPGSPWPLVGLAALALLAAVAIRIGVAARRANFGH